MAEVVKGETNGEPMVSVLITVYNREKYVATAIESVLAQTYRNFELIITDDCSRDPSLQIAQRYQADRRVKVYRNERNLGDYANRNRAASLAKGKYLKYVDADDLIYPHCLETMVHAMEMFPQAGFGISSSVPGVLSPAMLSPRETYLYDYGGGGLLDAGPLSTIVRRADFEAIGRFNEARHTSDGLCWLTMARRHGVAIIAPGLYWWRLHDEQESIFEKRSAAAIAEVSGRRFRFAMEALWAEDCPLSIQERKAFAQKWHAYYGRSVINAMLHMKLDLARRLVKEAGLSFSAVLKAFCVQPAGSQASVPSFQPFSPSPSSRSPIVSGLSAKVSAFQHVSVSASPPVVSVLIPAYNAERTIGEAIKSVQDQRFGNWELLIVDDASTDRTAQIAASFASDPRVRLLRNEQRLGKWANHNRGAEAARGEFVKFLHADDLLYPHCLEHLLYFGQKYRQAGLIQSCEGVTPQYLAPKLQTPREAYQQEYFGAVTLWESPTGMVYRRDAWKSSGGLKADCPSAPARLHLEMARTAPVLLVYGGLAGYRRGSQQLRHRERGDFARSMADLDWLSQLLHHPECPLEDSEVAVATRNLQRLRRKWALSQWLGEEGRLARFAYRRLRPSLRYGAEYWGPYYRDAVFDPHLYPDAALSPQAGGEEVMR